MEGVAHGADARAVRRVSRAESRGGGIVRPHTEEVRTVRKRARVDNGPQKVAHMTPRGMKKRRIDFAERGEPEERGEMGTQERQGDEEWAPEEWEEAMEMEQEMTWAEEADAFGDG